MILSQLPHAEKNQEKEKSQEKPVGPGYNITREITIYKINTSSPLFTLCIEHDRHAQKDYMKKWLLIV